MTSAFSDPGEVSKRLSEAGYLPDEAIATVAFLADLRDVAAAVGSAVDTDRSTRYAATE